MKNVLVVILLFTLLLNTVLIIIALKRQDRKQPIYFAVLSIATGMYILGYLLEIVATDYSGAVTALKVQNMGIPLLGPFFALLILRVCDSKLLRPWMPVSCGIYAFGIFLSVLFNDHLHWYYSDIALVQNGDLSYLAMEKGPLYLANQGVVFLCAVVGFSVLFQRFWIWKPSMRKQMGYVAAGSMLTFLANGANFLGIIPNMLDITPFATLLTMCLYTISLVRYRLFEIVPLASEVALQTMDDAMVVLDDDWCYLYCNDAAKLLLPALEHLSQADPIQRTAGWPEVLMEKRAGQVSFQLTGADGAARHYRARISNFGEQNWTKRTGWSIVIRDITELNELLDKMEVLASTDPLTGILNRRRFMEIVARELEAAKRHPNEMALIMFDLDRFKNINDTHGHLVGDSVLQAITQAVKRELRSYDVFARYGGEEFIIFSTCMNESDAERMAWRLCRTIEELLIQCRRTPIPVTASFGVTQMYARDTIEAATAAVDKALYQAKNAGRNCVRVAKIERPNISGCQQMDLGGFFDPQDNRA